ncbi:MAG: hypothetical protein JHC95_07215 [Solirubrobacteraceae bacterium]|nr:hypothetical protein [Solirubrobacteraceae bacterium]
MSLSDLAWLKYPIATAVLVVIFGLVGLPMVALLRNRMPRWAAALAPLYGIGIVMLTVSWYARLGWALPTWLVWLVVVATGGGTTLWAWRSGELARLRADLGDRRGALGTVWGLSLPWIVGIAAATVFMVPMITSTFTQPGFLTVFTFGNADVGAYVGEATNVQLAGYDNAGLYDMWNPGSEVSGFSADQDHTGANSLLAFSASALGSDVWKTAQIVLMLSFAGLLAGAVAVVRWFMPTRPRIALAIGALASSSFLVWYLVGNYFLAQVLCLAMITAQLILIFAGRTRPFDWRIILSLAIVAGGNWLSSPELQVVLFMLAGALVLADFVSTLVVRAEGAFRQLWRQSAGLLITLVTLVILVFPFATVTVERSKRVYGYKGGVGWTLDLHDSVLIFLGYPSAISTRAGDLGAIALWAAVIAFVAAVGWVLFKRDRVGIAAGVVCTVTAAAAIFGASRWDWTGYQGWKLIITLSVPFLIFAGVLLSRIFTGERLRMFALACAILFVVNVLAGSRMWDPLKGTEAGVRHASLNADLATFLDDPKVVAQKKLNVYVPSMYATMIVPSMYEQKAAMSSPSYYSNAKPGPSPYACSLVEASMYKKRMGKVAYANHGYLLVNTPRCS